MSYNEQIQPWQLPGEMVPRVLIHHHQAQVFLYQQCQLSLIGMLFAIPDLQTFSDHVREAVSTGIVTERAQREIIQVLRTYTYNSIHCVSKVRAVQDSMQEAT